MPRALGELTAEAMLRHYHPAWPKPKPCLRCGRMREATSPGDRLHDYCRMAVDAETDAAEYALAVPGRRSRRG